MPVRILHLIETLGPGGAERLLYTNLRHLDRTRFAGIVCPLYDRSDHWGPAIREMGYLVKSPKLRGRLDWRRGLFRLRDLMRAEQINLIHTHLYGANLYGRFLARALGVPVLTTLHNPDHNPEVLTDNPSMSHLKFRLARMLDRWTSHYLGFRWIAVSEYVRAQAIQWISLRPDTIDVIYNGIEVNAFSSEVETRRTRIRAALGFKENEPLMLTLGRLNPQKGQRYLIQALPEIVASYPSARLLVVGTGPRSIQDDLQKTAAALGVARNTDFLGVRRDVADLLAGCDLFLFPSVYEGMGIALVEAMAAGRACIASHVGAIPEVVVDGTSGLLVKPRDSKALAAAVLDLLSDSGRRSQLGARAQERARLLFDVGTSVRRLQEVYEKTLDEWSRRHR